LREREIRSPPPQGTAAVFNLNAVRREWLKRPRSKWCTAEGKDADWPPA